LPILTSALAISVTYNLIIPFANRNTFGQYNFLIKNLALFTNFLLIKAKANTLILTNAGYNNSNRFLILIKKESKI